MNTIIDRFNKIKSNINNSNNTNKNVNIVAVSKSFSHDYIRPLIDLGHNHFGENKVQEAEEKWKNIKNNNKNVK
jgi:Predicted enzyme with a TIM-barrel fold